MTDPDDRRERELAGEIASALGAARKPAARELLPLVYDQLRALADRRLASLPPGQTLQGTALVHEAWLRVAGDEDPTWDSKAHFFGAASRAMRNILVDQARRKASEKHGGHLARVEGDIGEAAIAAPQEHTLAFDEALDRLEAFDAFKARIVMLRFYGGLTMPEVAETLGVSLTKAETEWRFARAWLKREMADPAAGTDACST